MYRLLIVDDETYILEGLVQLFSECEDLELEIYKTYSSLEAIEIIKKNKIDIVLSDIRMPEMDGFQLVDKILYYLPKCRVIFLTGYSEFDYVYSAIHRPNVNYILKSEKDETIIKTVEDAISSIEEEVRQQSIMQIAERQIERMVPLLRKELFELILQGDIHSQEVIEERFKELDIQMKTDRFVIMILGRIDSCAENPTHTSKINTFYTVQQMINDLLTPFVICESVLLNSRVIWLMQPASSEERFVDGAGHIDWNGFLTYIKGNMETIQNMCKDVLGVTFSFILPKEPTEWKYIQMQFDTMGNIVDRRIPEGHQMIIDLGKPGELLGQSNGKMRLTDIEFITEIKELGNQFTKGQQRQVENICRSLLNKFKEDMKVNYMVTIERYHTFMLVFISYLNKYSILDYTRNIGLNIDKIFNMEFPRDWDKTEQNFVGLGNLICMYMSEHCEHENDLVIEQVNKHIRDNLGGDLSLSKIAETVHFNPSYLSRFYKQTSGQNISDYINAEKYKKARELLNQTPLKVNEIAAKLGFENVSYFISFFKKHSALTPQEFRESM